MNADVLPLQPESWQALKILSLGPGSWRISGLCAGQARCLHVLQLGPGRWRLFEAGQSQVLDLQPERSRQKAAPASTGEQAPMAGVMRGLSLEPGSEVQAGDVLYVLEAMKMQVQVCAQASARVQAVQARNGERVQQGQPILSFEK